MERKENFKKLAVKTSALVLSVFMLASAALPVMAAEPADSSNSVVSDSAQSQPYTIRFLCDGQVMAEFPASAEDTWGPAGTISVRSTYYKDETDYDIVSGPEGALSAASDCLQTGYSAKITGNMDFIYQPHQNSDTREEKIYQCMTEDGMLLYQFTGTEDKIPKTLETGSKVYARSSKKNDSQDSGVVFVYYQLQEDTNTHYTVKVTYVDEESGKEITTRTFYVNNRPELFMTTQKSY